MFDRVLFTCVCVRECSVFIYLPLSARCVSDTVPEMGPDSCKCCTVC
jgi:hypothetical protein